MTIKDNEDIENSIKCWICDNAYFAGDSKVRDHCHWKYRVLDIETVISLLN